VNNKKGEITLLLPGSLGWEIWTGLRGQDFERQEISDSPYLNDVPGLQNRDIALFFPVREATVMPFIANTTDPTLFDDTALMHSERLGVRVDASAGQLMDTFLIEQHEQHSVLSTMVLRAPGEGELPSRSPKSFDYSPRAYAFAGHGLAVWKELGYWVFCLYQHSQMLYAQATSIDAEHPDDSLLREVKLALIQLQLQGMDIQIQQVHVWHPAGELGDAGALTQAFGVTAQVTNRPLPNLPAHASKLLPADVHAERRAQAKQRSIAVAALSFLVLLVGWVGWMGFDLWQQSSQTQKLKIQASAVEPEVQAFTLHQAKWRELGPLVDADQWPLETLHRISRCLPPTGGVRLRTAEISNQEVRIVGEAPMPGPIGQLNFAINKSDQLTRFKFRPSQPTNTPKGWEFTTVGEIPTELNQ